MEKFRFGKELKEAVLFYKDGQMYVVVGREKRRVRSPVLMKIDGIEEKGVTCLVSEGAGDSEMEVVAVLFDDLRREGKDWICVNPRLTEQAVGFFLEHHQMEKMVSDYKSVIREKETGLFRPDFLLDDVCIIEIRLPSVGISVVHGSFAKLIPMAKAFERFLKCIKEPAVVQDQMQKIIFLFLLPYKGDSSLQYALNQRIKQDLNEISRNGIKVEFWSAEMEIDQSGIALSSYQEITDMILRQ